MWNLNISLEGENGIVSGRVSRKVLAGDRFSSGSYCETPGLRRAALLPVPALRFITSKVRRTQSSPKSKPVQAPLWHQYLPTVNATMIVLVLGAWVWGTFSTSWVQFSSSVKWSFWLHSVVLCCGIKWNNMYYIFFQSNTHTASPYAKMFSEIWGCNPGCISVMGPKVYIIWLKKK